MDLNDPDCGNGTQVQRRLCTDGSIEKCTDEDTNRNITCDAAGTSLPDCPKVLGIWETEGDCIAVGDDPACGHGNQGQKRSCKDGTVNPCTDEETMRTVSCEEAQTSLPDCMKILGEWENRGVCSQVGDDPTCGHGTQEQERECKNGTVDKCTDEDTERTDSCVEAGSALPDCPKIFGGWNNVGSCIAVGSDPACGHGKQEQARTCKDGTVDRCARGNTHRKVTCELAGTALPNCPRISGRWKNRGACKGIGFNPKCGDGNQVQVRTCKHGTVEKCTDKHKQRIVTCQQAGTALPKCRKF